MAKKKEEALYTCDCCGKPATKNIQNNWHEYNITKKGDFKEVNSWDGDTSEFYCDKCYEENN
jgi:hypothetical protein